MDDNKIKIDLSVTDETNGQPKKNKQARDWCFTVNNPVQTEQEFLEYLKTVSDLRYAVFQRERAPETERNIIKGILSLRNRNGLPLLKSTRYRKRYKFLRFLSKKHGNRFIRVMKWAKEYRQAYLENKYKRQFRKMQVFYIYGSAGCGKTSYVFNKHGYDDVYRTTNYEFGWIDDYNGEKVLFLDEFRSSFKISEILDYLDGQPIRIHGRHFNRVACYDTVTAYGAIHQNTAVRTCNLGGVLPTDNGGK